MRRTWILFLLGLLVSTASAQSDPFLDVIGHPQAVPIDTLRIHGIIEGYGNGFYRPDIYINRAEFLKVLMLAAYGQQVTSDATACFTDFAGIPQWFWSSACAAQTYGIITGYPDGTFKGTQTVNLAEALAMAERAWQIPLPQYLRVPDHWYDQYFDAVPDTGIAEYFLNNPNHLLTRGDAAWLLVALGQSLAVIETPVPASSTSSASSISSASFVSFPSIHSVCGDGIKEGKEQCDDGNKEDGDGCSSLCIIVPEPVQHSVIRLDQRALGTDTYAGGTSQTILFSFDANARWQDAILTGLKFDPVQGAFRAAVNYRLYEDTDGDSRPETLVGSGLVRDNVLSFSGLDARIFVSRGKRFEIRADLVQTSGDLALGFRTSDDAYVEAMGAFDGRQLVGIRTNQNACPRQDNCWIAVYTQDAAPVTLTSQGNLFVTQASQPVRGHQLLAGTSTSDLLRISFRATDEEIVVRRIAITGATDAISALQLFSPGESSPFATATSGCRVPTAGMFCTSVNFSVQKDILRDVIVRATIKSADDGARSGDTIALTLSADTSVSDVAVEAVGVASQQNLVQNNGDFSAEGEVFIGRSSAGVNSAITGPEHDVVHTALKSIENTSADPDGSVIPVGLRTIGVFRFTAHDKPAIANASRNLTLTTLIFDVTATNVRFSTGSFVLVNMIAPTVSSPCIETAHSGYIRVTCSNFVSYGVNTLIPFGDYVNLGLKGFIDSTQNASGGTSLLQVSLTSVNNRGSSSSVVWNDGTSAFAWVDIIETDVRSTLYRLP
ncbi:MAG: S-layer homology domain-containing protein [Candidatus Peregrinibacteria bacterium]